MDDGHLEESVSWMAAESGVFVTDDGTTLQAASTTTRGGKFKAVKYPKPFPESQEPVVLSQVMSFNDATYVKARMAPCEDHNGAVLDATGYECPDAISILLSQSNHTCATDQRIIGTTFNYDTSGTNHIGVDSPPPPCPQLVVNRAFIGCRKGCLPLCTCSNLKQSRPEQM